MCFAMSWDVEFDGFLQAWVWVAIENPRVACGIPYNFYTPFNPNMDSHHLLQLVILGSHGGPGKKKVTLILVNTR